MPVKRISDAMLVVKAKRAEAIKERVKTLNKKRTALEEEVMKEMERRKTRVIEHNGTRLTRVQQEATVVDWDELKPHLTPRQANLCEKKVFDRKGLESAVQAGVIDIQLVSEHSDLVPKSPYLVVTDAGL